MMIVSYIRRSKAFARLNQVPRVLDPSPIQQVRDTVLNTDDPTLPTITLRTWILGPATCVIVAILTESYGYQQTSLDIPSICVLLVLYPLGKLMEKLPSHTWRIPCTNWMFSLNPGPFNIKEHVLLGIMAVAGLDYPLALDVMSLAKKFYKVSINPWGVLSLSLGSQLLGFGFAGLFKSFMVDNAYMWWPTCLINVSFFRSMHEIQARDDGRFKFVLIITVITFMYQLLPGYFVPSLSIISTLCLFFKESIWIHLIGSGRYGFGFGAFSLDWSIISSYIGDSLASPLFGIINTMVGFILFLYVIVPLLYYFNFYDFRRFPFWSDDELYDFHGQPYNITRILDKGTMSINLAAYKRYSKIYMSAVSVCRYAFLFASLSSTVTYFALYYARDAWLISRKIRDHYRDVHNRLMDAYLPIPYIWFSRLSLLMIVLAIISCLTVGAGMQLPVFGVLYVCLLALVVMLPLFVIEAISGQSLPLNLISQILVGYLYPGKVLASISFKAYAVSVLEYARLFLFNLKLGHYLKIPPRSIFFFQLIGTVISSVTHFSSSKVILSEVDNVCELEKLPDESPWTCYNDQFTYYTSIVWGLMGPARIFAHYPFILYCILIGILLTLLVWFLQRWCPRTEWIQNTYMPIILGAPSYTVLVGAVGYWAWGWVGIFFNYYVSRNYEDWWAEYNYLLPSALDLGVILSTLFVSLIRIFFPTFNWSPKYASNECSLVQCPTIAGVYVDGCPNK